FSTRPTPQSTLFPYTTLFRSPERASTKPPQRTEKTAARVGPQWLLREPFGSITRVHATTLARSDPSRRSARVTSRKACPHPGPRSEEHTSELQSRGHLVCRLL